MELLLLGAGRAEDAASGRTLILCAHGVCSALLFFRFFGVAFAMARVACGSRLLLLALVLYAALVNAQNIARRSALPASMRDVCGRSSVRR